MKNILIILYVALVLVIPGVAVVNAGDKDFSEIVDKQQAMLDEMQAEIDSLHAYVDDDDADFLGDIQMHGFISQGYLYSKNNNQLADTKGDGTFQFNEIGINFTSQLSDNLRMGVQFLSRDMGYIDQNKVRVDWAYLDYYLANWLGIRAGKIKCPMGLQSETRDVDMLRTPVLLPFILAYGEPLREATTSIQGGGIYGMVDAGKLGSFNYAAQVGVTSHDTKDGGVKYMMEGMPSIRNSGGEVVDIGNDGTFISRVNWNTPIEGLLLGGSFAKYTITADIYIPAYSVHSKMEFNDFVSTVASAQYTIGELVLTSEYQRVIFDVEPLSDTYEYNMWYATADYRFNDLYSMAIGYTEYVNAQDRNGEQAAAAGYDDFTQWTKDWYVSTKFDLTENWLFKAEIHFLDGDMHNIQALNPDGSDRHDVLLALKTTVSF